MTQLTRTRSLPLARVAKRLKMPQFKIGDIIMFGCGDGKTHKFVVKKIDKPTGIVRLISVLPRTRFSDEVKRRLEADEVDYDFSKTPDFLLPFTFKDYIYRPLEC